MYKKATFFLISGLLISCSATQPPPYQADRKPEDRTNYHGLEGLKQKQKDQEYLMSKELTDKCENARVDLAVAESQEDQDEVKRQKSIIDKACR